MQSGLAVNFERLVDARLANAARQFTCIGTANSDASQARSYVEVILFHAATFAHSERRRKGNFAICVGTGRPPCPKIPNMGKKQKIQWFAAEWRAFRRMTLEQAAESLATSAGYLSDLEKGKRRFNQDHLERMGDAYRCDWRAILVWNPLMDGEPPASLADDLPRAAKALEAFKKAS